ncbi:hypothetical protein MRX96_015669 [Rhipicephalus microplus]
METRLLLYFLRIATCIRTRDERTSCPVERVASRGSLTSPGGQCGRACLGFPRSRTKARAGGATASVAR